MTAACGGGEGSTQPDGGGSPDATAARLDAAPESDAAAQDDAGPEPVGPDLQVTDATASASLVQPDSQVTVTATVENHGDESGDITLELEVDGSVDASQTLSVDPPREGEEPEDTAVEADFSWSSPEEGSFELSVNGVAAGTVTVKARLPPGYRVVTEEVTLAAGDEANGAVTCPSDTVVISGGAFVDSLLGTDEAEVRIKRSHPGELLGVPAWVAHVQNLGSGTRTVHIEVICATQPPGYEIVEENVTLESGAHERITAACPDGKAVLGGGTRAAGDVRIHEAAADFGVQPAWLTAIENKGDADRGATVSAICADEPSGYEVVESTQTVASGEFVRTTQNCDGGKVILGGGAQVVGAGTGNFDMRLQESVAFNLSSLFGWLIAIENRGAGPRDVRFQAICADPLPGYTSDSISISDVEPGEFARLFPECPSDTVVLGGGAGASGGDDDSVRLRIHESSAADLAGAPVWFASVQNQSATEATMEVVAICAEEPAGYAVATREESVAAGDVTRELAQCPVDGQPSSGGARVVGDGSGNFDMRLLESGASGDSWISAIANRGTAGRTIEHAAVCAQGIEDYQVLTTTFTAVGPADSLELTALCPDNTAVLGGGVQRSGAADDDGGLRLKHSAPVLDEAWRVRVQNEGEASAFLRAVAVCGN